MLAIAVLFGVAGSICALQGIGAAVITVVDPGALVESTRESDPVVQVFMAWMGVLSLVVGVAFLNYAYILFRRATVEGTESYEIFRGRYGWFGAIGGLVFSAGFVVHAVILILAGVVSTMMLGTFNRENLIFVFLGFVAAWGLWRWCSGLYGGVVGRVLSSCAAKSTTSC